jgi:hypothetical protein
MGLMDATEYDPRPARRRWMLIGLGVTLLITLVVLWFWPSGRFRHWQEWNIANKFFTALERQDFDSAYALYNADSDWKQHPEKYNQYSQARFTLDWGPAGDYGKIVSHHMVCAIEPPKKGFGSASGVVAVVIVNGHTEPTLLWIEKKSGTITTSPWDMYYLTRDSPLVRARCVNQE